MKIGLETNQLSTDLYLYDTLQMVREMNETHISILNQEEDVFTSILEATDPDAVSTGTMGEKVKEKVKSDPRVKAGLAVKGSVDILKGIKDFIKKMFEKFIATCNKLLVENTKWLDNKYRTRDKIDFTKLKVQLDPNYIKAEEKVIQSINDPLFKTLTNPNIVSDNFIKSRFGLTLSDDIKVDNFINSSAFKNYLDEKKSLTNGCKNMFRYGSAIYPKMRLNTYSGDSLKDLVDHSYNYCRNYGDLSKKIKSLVQFTDKSLSMIERKMNAENKIASARDNREKMNQVNENYFLIEDTVLENTILGEISGVEYLFENIKVGDEAGASRSESNDPGKKPSSQPVTSPRQDVRAVRNNVKSSTGNVLKVLKYASQCLQIYITSAMTVAEERFFQYLKVLKYALNKSNMTPQYKENENDVIA